MNKLLKIVFGFVGLVIVALVGLVVYVQVQYPSSKLTELVQVEASNVLGRDVTLKSASVSLFPVGVQVEGLSIPQSAFKGFQNAQFVEVEDAVFQLDLMKLLSGQIYIAKVSVDGLALNFEQLSNGKSSITGLSEGEEVKSSTSKKIPDLPFDLNLSKLEFNDFNINYLDHLQGQQISVQDLSFKTKLFVKKDLTDLKTVGELQIRTLRIKDQHKGVRTGDVSLSTDFNITANLRSEVIVINSLKTKLQDIETMLEGKIKKVLSDQPHVNINLSTNEIGLAPLFNEIPSGIHSEIDKLTGQGSAQINLNILGPIITGKLPQLSGKIQLNSIGIAHKDIPAQLKNLNAEIHLTESMVDISKMNLNFANQPIKVVAKVKGLPHKPEIKKFRVDAKIDLKSFQGLAEKVITWPEGLALAGLIKANMNAQGLVRLDHPEKTSVSGEIKLEGIKVKSKALKDDLHIDGLVKLSSKMINPELKAKIGNENVDLDIQVKDPLSLAFPQAKGSTKASILLNVKSKSLNLDKILNQDPNSTPSEAPPANENPEIPNVNLDGTIVLAKTTFQNLKLNNFRMKLKMRNKVLKTDFTGQLYGGKIQQQSSLNLNNPLNGKIESKIQLTGVQANGIISDFNDNIKGDKPVAKLIRKLDNTVFGKLNLNLNLVTNGVPSSFLDNAKANISSDILNGKMKNGVYTSAVNSAYSGLSKVGYKKSKLKNGEVNFSNFISKIKLKNGNILIESMKIHQTPFGDMDLEGQISKKGQVELNTTNLLSNSDSKYLSKSPQAAMAFPFKQNRAMVYMKIVGDAGSPSVSIDYKKMAKNAKGTQVLDKKLKEGKAEVKKVVNEQKSKAKKELKKQTNKAKKSLKDQSKKALKGLF